MPICSLLTTGQGVHHHTRQGRYHRPPPDTEQCKPGHRRWHYRCRPEQHCSHTGCSSRRHHSRDCSKHGRSASARHPVHPWLLERATCYCYHHHQRCRYSRAVVLDDHGAGSCGRCSADAHVMQRSSGPAARERMLDHSAHLGCTLCNAQDGRHCICWTAAYMVLRVITHIGMGLTQMLSW